MLSGDIVGLRIRAMLLGRRGRVRLRIRAMLVGKGNLVGLRIRAVLLGRGDLVGLRIRAVLVRREAGRDSPHRQKWVWSLIFIAACVIPITI